MVIWFAVDLAKNTTDGTPMIGHDGAQVKVANWTCIAEVVGKIRDLQLPTAHLLAIGGWNAAHPDTSFTGAQWWETFKSFNNGLATEHAALGFDGRTATGVAEGCGGGHLPEGSLFRDGAGTNVVDTCVD